MNEALKEELIQLAKTVFDSPEPGFCEWESSKAQVAFLKEKGFEVTENVADTKTGYVASYGKGKPVIALLGEFDALYGLGQVCDVAQYKPDGKEMGHGCGHHLLGVGCIGAGLLVKEYLEKNHKEGTIRIYGCPAEESGSGKAYMARDGVFDDVDIAYSWHPSIYHMVVTGSSQSCIQCFFRFHGVSSHAAGSPERGRSALDAVELMDVGVNYLREHMESSDRVHYAITNAGGLSPNVVQAEAEVKYLIRSTTNKKCQALYERVCKIAQGAAMMTETSVDVVFDEGLSNTIVNFALEDVLYEAFQEIGVPEYTAEDLQYAQQFKDSYTSPISLEQLPIATKDKLALMDHMKQEPICNYIIEQNHSDICEMGSTDVGDVSWVVPTTTLNTACYSYGAEAHSWQWVAQGKSSIAMKGMLTASQVLARACEKVYEDETIIAKATEEFKKRVEPDGYFCLIPKEVKPHIPGEEE